MLNKITLIIVASLLFSNIFATEYEKLISSKVKNVTVYLQGAQVQRKGRFNLKKGITRIIFDGVTQNFNKNSIQAKGKGNFIILDVSHHVHYPIPMEIKDTKIPEKIKTEIKLKNDSIEKTSWKLKKLRADLSIYNNEKSILTSSGVMKGLNNSDSILLLKDALSYYRIKLLELNKLVLNTEVKIEKQSKLYAQLNSRLNLLNNWKSKTRQNITQPVPTHQIIVTVSTDIETSGSISLKYFTPNAGWTPSYDLRAEEINKPVGITYKARVFQNTGINWNNVNITLSTINPNQNNDKPVLAPWYISYYSPIQRGISNYTLNQARPQSAEKIDMEMDDLEVVDAKHISNFTEMSENMAAVEFELKIPYNIKSDGKEHLMAITTNKVKATFEYFAIPKKEREAFLMAKLTDWENLNLLPGIANIYYDGTYIGQTRISPSTMTDTLELALGRDQRIIVSQKKTKNIEKIKKVSNEKESALTYQITIKSLKNTAIKLTIMDQIPMTTTDGIKIKLDDKGNGTYNEYKGFLTWNVTLNPKETKKIVYGYTIQYDKDRVLVL